MRRLLMVIICVSLLIFPIGIALADNSVPATGIYLSQSIITITIGQTACITATVLPNNANQNVAWMSSNSEVANVQSGCVTGVSAGSATITAMTWGGGYTATCAVTVNPRITAATGVSLSETSISVPVHTVASLVATVQGENDTNAADQLVTWSSSNPNVATANAYGVYGESPGIATITATSEDGHFTATCTVTVTSNVADLSSLAVSGGTLDPAFNPATTSYTLTVGEATTSVIITPAAADNTAAVAINGNAATSGEAQTVSISNIGAIKVTVTASSGSNNKTYTLNVVRSSGGSSPENGPGLPVDVQGYWAATQIQTLLGKKIISGFPDGTFKPDQSITRAEFVTMLVNALGLTPGASQSDFMDVPPGDWCYNAVEAATQNGIAKGSGGNFDPDISITREQMAVMIDGALPIIKISAFPDPFALYRFSDRSRVDGWADKGIEDCLCLSLMNGVSESIMAPQADATRAQAAVMIYGLMVKANKI